MPVTLKDNFYHLDCHYLDEAQLHTHQSSMELLWHVHILIMNEEKCFIEPKLDESYIYGVNLITDGIQ